MTRLRLGKNADNELIIDLSHENYGWLMVIIGGQSYQYQHTFSKINPLDQKLQPIQVENRWGYQNMNGETIISPIYDYVYPFSKGVARVLMDGKQGYINQENEVVVPIQYDKIWHIFKDSPTAWVYKDRRWGVINIENNQTILPRIYNEIVDDENKIWVQENGDWGLVDSLNNVLAAPQYHKKKNLDVIILTNLTI